MYVQTYEGECRPWNKKVTLEKTSEVLREEEGTRTHMTWKEKGSYWRKEGDQQEVNKEMGMRVAPTNTRHMKIP